MIHEVTIKQSIKRHQMWQMKGTGHNIYSLNDMKLVLFKMIKFLGGSLEDTRTIYLLKYSPESFDGFLIGLKKVKLCHDSYGSGCEYSVTETNEIEFFMSDPVFPSAMKLLMDEWPDKLYLSLETTARRIMLPRR